MAEPTPPFRVRAIADYIATGEGQVSLQVGKEYVVNGTDGKGIWWSTTTEDGIIGWFPASYTQVIETGDPAPPPPPEPEPTPQTQSLPAPQPEIIQPQPVVQEQPQAVAPVNTTANLQQTPYTANSTLPAPVTTTATSSPRPSVSAGTPPLQRTQSVGSGTTPMKKVGAKKTSKKSSKAKRAPQPIKTHIEKNKKNIPTTLKLQLVEARGIRTVGGDMNKTNPTAFVFIRELMDDKDQIGRKIDCTATVKKTVEPRWNELFHIVVEDPETKEVIVRFVSGKKYDPKDHKKFLGEIKFPLRGSVRDYDSPNFQYKWYPLTGKDATGKCRIYIEFTDTRSVSSPTNFQRISHIGWSPEGGFDISNIPPEWKQLFKSVGIKKSDLRDKEFATTVFNIIQEHEKSGGSSPTLPSGAAPVPQATTTSAATTITTTTTAAATAAATTTTATQQQSQNNMAGYTSPDYPGWTWDGTQWVWTGEGVNTTTAVDNTAAAQTTVAAVSTPAATVTVDIPPAPAEPEPADSSAGAPPPPPPPPPPMPSSSSSGGAGKPAAPAPAAPDARSNLLASIRDFSGGLKPVGNSPKQPPPPPESGGGGGGGLAETLRKAMENHRRGISGANDTPDDDWSDDDDDNDDWDD